MRRATAQRNVDAPHGVYTVTGRLPHLPKVLKDYPRSSSKGPEHDRRTFFYIFAVLEVGYGIGVFLRSQDAIIAPLAIGFAILTAALAAILMEVGQSRELLQRLARM